MLYFVGAGPGDPGIYASNSYLMKHIVPHHPCKMVPGITAMCAAAAELGIPLCEQGESLLVIDHLDRNEMIIKENTVVMKAEKNWDQLGKLPVTTRVYLARNIGLPDQKLGIGIDGFGKDSYFTTAVMKMEC